MIGKEYVILGTLMLFSTLIYEFIFNSSINAFGMSFGIFLSGIIMLIIERK